MLIRFYCCITLILIFSSKIYSQGCITLQGMLTDSTVCLGDFPMLTFTSVNGTGPFILTYSNGTKNFTQNNVQSGVPFIIPDIPSANATYTLTSIQDASGCPAVAVNDINRDG